MKNIFPITFSFLLALNICAVVSAQKNFAADDFFSGKKIVMKHNFMNNIFAVGSTVEFSGLSYEDVVILGINIRFSGASSFKDVYIAGDNVEISGNIKGNLRIVARQITIDHLTVEGNTNVVAPEIVIFDDVRFKKSMEIWSSDVQMGGWYSNLHIKTKSIIFSKNLFVDKKLVVQSTEKPAIPANVMKHCDFVYEPPIHGKIQFFLSSKLRRLFSFLSLCFPFLLMFFITPRILQETIDIIEKRPVWIFLTGILLLILTPLILILLMLTVIGAPLGLIFFTFYLSFLYLCRGFASIALGRTIFRRLKEGKTKMIVSILVGTGIFVFLASMPKVGYFFQIIFVIFGFGGFAVGRIRMFIKLKKQNLI